jgi:hypothetical protein
MIQPKKQINKRYRIRMIGADPLLIRPNEILIIQPKTKEEYEETIRNIFCKYRTSFVIDEINDDTT